MQFVDGPLKALPVAERLDELHWRSERRKRGDAKHVGVIEIKHALVGIFGEQRVEHGAGLWTVFREHIALLDVFGALAPGERFSVEGDVADQIEGIEVLA